MYIHKDRLGAIIYVGKARDLRKRLASYFTPSRK
ncbi:MAG: GIY-YIG nuclease family protein, partial [Verrucomicrobiota bacterium]